MNRVIKWIKDHLGFSKLDNQPNKNKPTPRDLVDGAIVKIKFKW